MLQATEARRRNACPAPANPAAPPTQGNLGVWDDWEFWQWSDGESIGGESPVDANLFQGTVAELNAFRVNLEPTQAGDYNGDGVVNAADYTLWRDTWLQFGDFPADGDGDGFVGNSDYDLWEANYGEVLAAAAATPEPTTGGVALVGAAVLAALGRRRTGVLRSAA